MICTECDSSFDSNSKEKKRAGGLINHCPDCSEETSVKVVAVSGSDGKMAGIEILRFETEEDKKQYIEFWRINSGIYKGKSCQLKGNVSTPSIKFKKIYENHPNGNHKGKK